MRQSLLCLLLTTLLSVPIMAQSDKAVLTGTVIDSSHATIIGATVTITNVSTGVSHSAKTNSDGDYRLSALPVGNYTASIDGPGFQRVKFKTFPLEVGATRTLNAELTPATVKTEVSVVDATPDLDMATAAIGSVIKGSQTQNLPLNGRSWVRLLALVPGAIDDASGTEDQIRFAGMSQEDNNFLFDGVDATGINHQFEKVDLRLQLSTEAIAEFRATSALFSADQGGSAGGQVEIVSRSGTNEFRGSTWEFLRNSMFDARPWNSTGLPHLTMNNYGANFGGPVIKDKLFFFVNWESLRQSEAQPISGFVPTDAFRAQAVANNPAVAPIMQAYPGGNAPSTDPNALQWFGSSANTISEDSGLFRVDYYINNTTQLAVRFNTDHYYSNFPNGIGLTQGGKVGSAFNGLNTPNALVDLQHSFSPNLLNDLKLGFNRDQYLEGGNGILPYEVTIPGFSSLSLPSASNRNDNAYTIADDATFVRGRHSIKSGISVRAVQENKASPNVDQPAFTWNSESDFLNNKLNSYGSNGAVAETGQRQTNFAGYVMDDFKAKPNLTLNLGLRYDFFGVDHEQFGRGIVVDPYSCPDVVCPAGAAWYQPNTLNFQPRVSIAWEPALLHGRTVIRAGYGMFVGQGQFGHLGGPIGNISNKFSLQSGKTLQLAFPITPFLYLAKSNVSYGAQDRNRQDFHVDEWTMSIQHEVARNTTATATYLGSEGYHLWTPTVINTLNPITGLRSYSTLASNLSYNATDGVSSFNALQLGLQRRATANLLVSANYQWSHALDDGAVGGAEGNAPENVNCRSCEKGNSSFDVRQYFSASALWQLPVGRGRRFLPSTSRLLNALVGGWQLGMIGTAKTGLPLNVSISRPATLLPDGNNGQQRPNLIAGVPLYPTDQSPSLWLNPAAFALPGDGTWGNAGRDIAFGPGHWQLDTSLQKKFALTERVALSFRAEAFNVFNVAQYGSPVTKLTETVVNGKDVLTTNNFGVIQGSYNSDPTGSGTPREIQLMLRLDF